MDKFMADDIFDVAAVIVLLVLLLMLVADRLIHRFWKTSIMSRPFRAALWWFTFGIIIVVAYRY